MKNIRIGTEYKVFYTFEKACEMRTKLNQDRNNKKNLWLLGEVKEDV